VNKLRGKADRDRGKGRSEASTFGSSISPPQMDEVTKLIKSLSERMERLELEGKQTYKNPQNADNRGNFRRPNKNAPQIFQREQRNRDKHDQKIQNPLQNNLVVNNDGEEEDLDPKIHCIGDTSSFPHLTQSTYEVSLMENQLNELSKRDKANNNPNIYNLRSKKKEGNPDVSDQPTIAKRPAKDASDDNKGKKVQSPILKVKEIPKPTSHFNF
jgi:hypothetical protein